MLQCILSPHERAYAIRVVDTLAKDLLEGHTYGSATKEGTGGSDKDIWADFVGVRKPAEPKHAEDAAKEETSKKETKEETSAADEDVEEIERDDIGVARGPRRRRFEHDHEDYYGPPAAAPGLHIHCHQQ